MSAAQTSTAERTGYAPLIRFCTKCNSECTDKTFWSNMLRKRFCFSCAEVALVEMLDASKGGNVRGVTEDHRFVMCDELKEVRTIAAAKTGGAQ